MNTRSIVLAGLFAAIISVLAQVSIPISFSPVPITGQIFGVFLAGAILGSRLGGLSMLVYLILGAVGLPVFANASGGLAVLFGKTGGYLLGFVLGAYLLGRIVEGPKPAGYLRMVVGMTACLVIAYAMGAAQLALVMGLPLKKALLFGVLPYIPLDIAKLILATPVSLQVRRGLQGAGLLPGRS